MKKFGVFLIITLLSTVLFLGKAVTQPKPEPPLWQVYQQSLKTAKYVDLTHTITPAIPVWAGFGASTFAPTINPNRPVRNIICTPKKW